MHIPGHKRKLLPKRRSRIHNFGVQQKKGEGYGQLVIQTAEDSHEEKKFFDFSIDGGNTIPVDLDDCEITQESFQFKRRNCHVQVLRRFNLDKKMIKAPKWILVVEKYAVYERLMKSKYGIDDGGLVITGRGIPDRATRNLLSGRDLQTHLGFWLHLK